MLFGKLLNQPGLNAQRLAHVTQGAARPVADHRGGNGGAVVAILFIDVLDDFFAPLVLEVHINVGRLAALAADKALKQQFAFSRVDGRHAQAKTHGRIGRRAAPLTQNVLLPGKTHDVMHRDEEHLIFQLLNQAEFMVKLGLDFCGDTAGVAPFCPLGRQPAQALCGRLGCRHHVFLRIAVERANLVQAEAAARSHRQRGAQKICRINIGQPHSRAKVRLGIGLQGKAAAMHRLAQLDGRHHIVQRLARAHMHQHLAGRHQAYAGAVGDFLQLLQAQRIVQALQKLYKQPAA